MVGFLKRIFSFGKKKVEEDVDGVVPEPADVPVLEQSVGDVDSSDMGDVQAFGGDGIFQPTPETAPADIGAKNTPEPLSETPEPTMARDDRDRKKPQHARTAKLDATPKKKPQTHKRKEAEKPAKVSQSEATEIVAPRHETLDQPKPTPVPVPKAPMRDDSRGFVTLSDDKAPPKQDAPSEPAPPKGWLARLTSGLSRSSKQLTDNIAGVFTKRKLDDDTLEELEDILLQADLGMETAIRITDSLASGRFGKDISVTEVRDVMASEIEKVLEPVAQPLQLDLSYKPHVILIVGVNGTGKTTTIGKLAAKLRAAGLSVTLGAGDTFRAAAIEQLKIWADRTSSQFVGTKLGADAAGLAYGAYETARENGSDVVIIDTAGRLQNKTELMDELAKIVRVLQKHDPDAPHTVLQTLDATTGQNALNQVEIFRNIAGVNGLVMTKLDGTARGGILVAISAKYKLPVYFIGVGEGVEDLEPFRAKDFAQAIAGSGDLEPTS